MFWSGTPSISSAWPRATGAAPGTKHLAKLKAWNKPCARCGKAIKNMRNELRL